MTSSWRKTGSSASQSHYEGLSPGVIFEAPAYDDDGRQQGHLILLLVEKDPLKQTIDGELWLGHVLSVQDEYYLWWQESTFGPLSSCPKIPIHFCSVPASRCKARTSYHSVTHVDVFRLLEGDAYMKLRWMTSEKKRAFQSMLNGVTVDQGLPEATAPASHSDPNPVLPGAAGLSGLAAALGASQNGKGTGYPQLSEVRAAEQDLADTTGNPRQQGQKKRSVEDARDSGVNVSESYHDIISERKPRESRESALRLSGKRKRKKSCKERKRSSSAGSTTSGDDEPVFRLASLPEGVDKLREMHERKPGHLANLTLLRYQELLERSTGREATNRHQDAFPPVGRAYLSQIYMVRHPSQELGPRTTREMQTILTAIDYLASNDVLRALDVLIQRQKALELAAEQGSWSQANLLELVNPSEERSYFRQELKAVQSEHKAELQLQRNPWALRRPWWGIGGKGRGAGKGDTDPEAAPLNVSEEEQKGNKKGNKGGKGGKHRGWRK